MDIAIVTDELKLPQREALPLIAAWGISRVELRGLSGGRIPDGDLEEARRLIAEHRMTVTSISPGVFKCAPEQGEIEKDMDRLRRTIAVCPTFGCRQIIVFTVANPRSASEPSRLVVEAIREAGKLAGEAGIRLALENEPGYTAVGARSLADLIERVGMSEVGANWDPGNAWPYDPDIDAGPSILGDRLFNVHAKDTAMRGSARVFDSLGLGEIDWRKHVDGLREAGYDGMFVVETHCEPGVEKSRASVEAARALLS